MSNIRGISDLRSAGPPPVQAFPRLNASRGQALSANASNRDYHADPVPAANEEMPQEYYDMQQQQLPTRGSFPLLGQLFCPRFEWMTFTTIISLIQITVFIATLIVGGLIYSGAFVKSNTMGGPGGDTLLAMGAKYAPSIKAGNVWRLITPIFLHAGFIHIISNLFFQLRVGFLLEHYWGVKRFIAIYFLAGVMGSLWSCVISPRSISVGASGALFGLLGGELAWLWVNWEDMAPMPRSQELCSLVIILLVNFLLGFAGPNIDVAAHAGGLLGGFLASGFLLASHFSSELVQAQPKEIRFRLICASLYGAMFFSFLLAVLFA